jgi:hypothetical protein
MKLSIEEFTSNTGWTYNNNVTFHGYNKHGEFVAGGNTQSMIFKFAFTDSGQAKEVVKSGLSIDVTDYEDLVFSVWSRNKQNSGNTYKYPSEFVYQIEVNGSKQMLIPLSSTFTDVVMDITDINTITQIKITALHSDTDYLVMSHMVAVTDQIPLDCFRALQDEIKKQLGIYYPRFISSNSSIVGETDKGIKIGTITGTTGDKSIILNKPHYLEHASAIKIDDGVNSEIHHIESSDNKEHFFSSLKDGRTLLNDYTNAPVYLYIDVSYHNEERQIILPSVAIWGMTPEPEFFVRKEDIVRDTMQPSGVVNERQRGQSYDYNLIISCEARTLNVMNFMSKVVRDMIGREVLWINGRKIDIDFVGSPTFIEPKEDYNEIPMIQYTVNIELKEDIFTRESLSKVSQTNITVTPKRSL